MPGRTWWGQVLKVEDLLKVRSQSLSLSLHSYVSVTWKGGVVGPGGVSDLAGQLHGASVSVNVAAQDSRGAFLG